MRNYEFFLQLKYMTKKKLAILIFGGIRTNNNQFNIFKEGLQQYLLTDENKNDYEINFFLGVDNSIGEDLNFSENIKSIIEIDKETTDNSKNFGIDFNLLENKNTKYYQDRINNLEKHHIYSKASPRFEGQLRRFYKLYRCYLSMVEYEKNIKHDFIAIVRPDAIFLNNISLKQIFNEFELAVSWDHFFIGKYDIMEHLCKIIFDYGKYNMGEIIHKNVDKIINDDHIPGCNYYTYKNIKENRWLCWSESPEVQTTEHLFDFIYKNNIDMTKINSNILRKCIWFQSKYDSTQTKKEIEENLKKYVNG